MPREEEEEYMEDFVADDGPINVDLDALEESDSSEVETTDEPRRTRLQKKRDRYDEVTEKNSALEREVAELRGRVEAYNPVIGQQQQRREPDQDPDMQRIEGELKQVDDGQKSLTAQWASADAAKQAELHKQYQDLQDKRTELVAQRAAIRNRPSPQQVSAMEMRRQFEARYPDIAHDERAYNHAVGTYQIMKAEQGPQFQDSWETIDKVINETRTKLGLKGYQASGATKRRHAGHSSRGGGGGESTEPAVLQGFERKQARAMYPDLEPKQAYAKYYKNVKSWDGKVSS